MTGKINVAHLECADGALIGIVELDNPTALNALSFNMIEQLHNQLLLWQQDESIVAVFLHANGEKAFCAGGDIQAIYRALENKEQEPQAAQQAMATFFTLEYQCDYLIHTYSKPIIAWGHGYLMGGGVGLYMGASHRVAANNTRFAMPESKIGLYPDVGATYFLNQLPQHQALFLGLTAAQINAIDMKNLGLCQWVVEPQDKDIVLAMLASTHWNSSTDIHHTIASILESVECTLQGVGLITPLSEVIQTFCFDEHLVTASLAQIVQRINHAQIDDEWFKNAQRALKYGSPLSQHICYQQLTQNRGLSLEACFSLEFSLTLRCGLEGDFREGVRALVIDKSHDPSWLYPDVSSVPAQLLEYFFSPVNTSYHPQYGLKPESTI